MILTSTENLRENDMLKPGKATGFRDSFGEPILFGGYVKIPCDINHDLHGSYAIFQVESRGTVPVVSYRYSERGLVLPRGMTGQPLPAYYDPGELMASPATDMPALRPMSSVTVIPTSDGDDNYSRLKRHADAEKQWRRESRQRKGTKLR